MLLNVVGRIFALKLLELQPEKLNSFIERYKGAYQGQLFLKNASLFLTKR